MKRKTLTLLFIDVHGYTSRTARQTREENELFIKEIRSYVEKHCKDKGGIFVKAMGDGFLLSFESPTDAVSCGRDLQQYVEQRNSNILNEDNFIRFRIGISTGEVTVDDDNDVYGHAVNVAARIQSFADPNGVYISESTYLAMNKTEVKALDLGPQRFKNLMQEVRVYKVVKEEGALKQNRPLANKVPLLVGAVAITLIAVLFFFVFSRQKARDTLSPAPHLDQIREGQTSLDSEEGQPAAAFGEEAESQEATVSSEVSPPPPAQNELSEQETDTSTNDIDVYRAADVFKRRSRPRSRGYMIYRDRY